MYSLGCTFYYLLAGIPPYPGGDITDKLTRHARAPAPDIRDLRPDIPAGVAAILLRMMAKQPEDRFADYDALIAALDAVCDWPMATRRRASRWSRSRTTSRRRPPAEPSPGGAKRRRVRACDRHGLGLDLPLESTRRASPWRLADERARGIRGGIGIEAEGPLPRLGRATTTG